MAFVDFGFGLKHLAEEPLDYRLTGKTKKFLQDLIDDGATYPGLKVFIEDENEYYAFKAVDGSYQFIIDRGPTGPQGEQGPAGKDGATGPTGDTGADGKQGQPGKDGDVLASVTASVTDTVGKPGVVVTLGGESPNRTLDFAFRNIKGSVGDQGPTGPQGAQGVQGPTGAKGDKGDQGDQGLRGLPGDPAIITGAEATIDNQSLEQPIVNVVSEGSSTSRRFVFNFKGLKGAKGDKGDDGTSIKVQADEASCTELGDGYIRADGHLMILSSLNPKQFTDAGNIRGPQGEKGSDGAAASITVGSVSSSDPGTDPIVNNSGSSSAAVLDFVIPRGDTGPQGLTGPTGAKGEQGETGAQGPKGEQGAQGIAGKDGVDGEKGDKGDPGAPGAVFTPSVSEEGVIEWTNNGGLANPTSVNIKGPKGDTGAKGDTGSTGLTGPAGPTGATGSISDFTFDVASTQDRTITISGFYTPDNLPEATFKQTYAVDTEHPASGKYIVTTEIAMANMIGDGIERIETGNVTEIKVPDDEGFAYAEFPIHYYSGKTVTDSHNAQNLPDLHVPVIRLLASEPSTNEIVIDDTISKPSLSKFELGGLDHSGRSTMTLGFKIPGMYATKTETSAKSSDIDAINEFYLRRQDGTFQKISMSLDDGTL